MAAPWFDPKLSWLPGTLLGCAIGLWGCIAGLLSYLGNARRGVLISAIAVMGVAAVFMTFGIVAYVQDQPRAIWYGLGYPGLLLLILSGVSIPILLARYRQAEERRQTQQELAALRKRVQELSEKEAGTQE
jgi:hypothetical protein